jgi:hypothetical protein
MTVVIGLAPNERGAAAVHLGSMMARSINDDLVVVTVVPTPWPPNPYRPDAEYLAYQQKAAEEALAVARSQLRRTSADGPQQADRSPSPAVHKELAVRVHQHHDRDSKP